MSRPMPFWLALTVAALTAAIAVRANTFTPWGTDAAAYVEEAHRWADGELFRPLPLQLWAPWSNDWTVAPYGLRPGVERGTEVGQYPLGFPLLMAAAIRLGGALAAYLVGPIAAGLLVWCAYLIASDLAGQWAGVLAAVVLAASPITLLSSVQPMSDVPAAAFWALAWAMSLRTGLGAASAAGAATTMAVMIRPNLAPLALSLLPLLLAPELSTATVQRRSWKRLAVFLCFAAIGPLIVAWSHAAMYGSPLRSGYLAQEQVLGLAYIPASLALYPRLLNAAHTPLIFVGVIGAALLWWPPVAARTDDRTRRIALSAVTFAGINYALYLPTVPLPDPGAVRYMQAAFTALVVLLAACVIQVARTLSSRALVQVILCVLPVAVVVANPVRYIPYAMQLREDQAHLRLAGYYLREALPTNAAIITSMQGTGLSHFTKRTIVRFDGLHPTALDGVISDLSRRGYHPVVILESEGEEYWFRAHFKPSSLSRIDWPPRAIVLNRLKYWNYGDRDLFARGGRWPVDVVTSHSKP